MVETAAGTATLVEKTVSLQIQSNDLSFPFLEASGLLTIHPKGFMGVKSMLVSPQRWAAYGYEGNSREPQMSWVVDLQYSSSPQESDQPTF